MVVTVSITYFLHIVACPNARDICNGFPIEQIKKAICCDEKLQIFLTCQLTLVERFSTSTLKSVLTGGPYLLKEVKDKPKQFSKMPILNCDSLAHAQGVY